MDNFINYVHCAMPYINFTFVYWIILKETILNLLDPSSTTSLVGKVIVCSLGEMSARGGLFTRGAKQAHMYNKNKKENQSTFQPCVKKAIQSREKYEEYPVTFQHRTNWQKCGEMTMTKLWLVLNYYLIGWQGHDSKLVREGSKVNTVILDCFPFSTFWP